MTAIARRGAQVLCVMVFALSVGIVLGLLVTGSADQVGPAPASNTRTR